LINLRIPVHKDSLQGDQQKNEAGEYVVRVPYCHLIIAHGNGFPLPLLFWHLDSVTCKVINICWGLEFVETGEVEARTTGINYLFELSRNGSMEPVVLLCLCEL